MRSKLPKEPGLWQVAAQTVKDVFCCWAVRWSVQIIAIIVFLGGLGLGIGWSVSQWVIAQTH